MTITGMNEDNNSFICVDIGSSLLKIAEAVKTDSGISFKAIAVEKDAWLYMKF